MISVVEALLTEAGIPYQVADRNMSVLEGSINLIQARILVPDGYEDVARQILVDAELGKWLRSR
ncbi:MAG: putative signal transducing protein [Nocardioidaceae bacterium]